MPVNLDNLNGTRRSRVPAVGIVSIVLLCIAIVVVVAYLIKLGLARPSASGKLEVAPEPEPVEPARPAEPAATGVSLVPMPEAVAVGAAVVESEQQAGNELPYVIEATGAAAADGPHGMDAMANAGVFGDLAVHDTTGASLDAGFGNIVPESHRMEGVSADSLNLGAVMPQSWRAGAEDSAAGGIQSESESDPLHDYFTPFGSLSEQGLEKEHPRWSELRLSREAVKRVIENIPDVTRQRTVRHANKTGIDVVSALRPPTKAPLATTTAHVFQDSQARLEVLSLGLQGTYPIESRGVA